MLVGFYFNRGLLSISPYRFKTLMTRQQRLLNLFLSPPSGQNCDSVGRSSADMVQRSGGGRGGWLDSGRVLCMCARGWRSTHSWWWLHLIPPRRVVACRVYDAKRWLLVGKWRLSMNDANLKKIGMNQILPVFYEADDPSNTFVSSQPSTGCFGWETLNLKWLNWGKIKLEEMLTPPFYTL